MKKLVVVLLILSAIIFIDYFIIALMGIFAHLCDAGCDFYQNAFGILSLGIIVASFAIAAIVYIKSRWIA